MSHEVSKVWTRKITMYFERIVAVLMDARREPDKISNDALMDKLALEQSEVEDFARGMNHLLSGLNGGMLVHHLIILKNSLNQLITALRQCVWATTINQHRMVTNELCGHSVPILGIDFGPPVSSRFSIVQEMNISHLIWRSVNCQVWRNIHILHGRNITFIHLCQMPITSTR